MRHLEAQELWIQQIVKSGKATIMKVNGKVNPADLFTKHLSRDDMVKFMNMLGFRMFNFKGDELGVKNFHSSVVGNAYDDMEYEREVDDTVAAVLDRFRATCGNTCGHSTGHCSIAYVEEG